MRPLGFVCADGDATVRIDDPMPRAFAAEPDRSLPLPYAYAIARPGTPGYRRLPALAEQLREEPDREPFPAVAAHAAPPPVHQPLAAKLAPPAPSALVEGPALGSGAARRLDPGESDDAPGVPWWLDGARKVPDLAPFDIDPGALVATRTSSPAGVALLGTFVSSGVSERRRFAITTDALVLPADRLGDAPGSAFRGQSVQELGLPVAFGGRADARFWALDAGRLEPRRRLAPRELVALTGKERVMGGARMVEARDGQWLRSDELRVIPKPSELPPFARGGRRWIDVSTDQQTLVLWEGERPVYATLVSIGKDGRGDPSHPRRAPQGLFPILQKHVTSTLSAAVGGEPEYRDVPWVMSIDGGYSLYGAYWHDDFGRERARGGIELAPSDARHVFEWSLPDVPEHWHGAYATDSFGDGTLLRIARR